MDPLSVIGAVSAVASLAGAGAKLSIFLFEVSSQIGSAADEIRELGSEISLFCAVLKQLQRVLGDAKRRRSSVTAIDTTQQIIDRCKLIFENIEETIKSLRVNKSKATSGDASGLDFKTKIRWTFKRNKVQTHRATLESCKITLTLMVSTLAYADILSTRKTTEVEDAEEEAILQSLSSAQLRANERLVSIEIGEYQDLEEEETTSPPMYELEDSRNPSSATASVPKDAKDMLGLHSEAITRSEPADIPKSGHAHSLEKASTWLKRLSVDDITPQDTIRPLSAINTASTTKHRQVEQLLFKWTDQGGHWASLQRQDEDNQSVGHSDPRQNKLAFTRNAIGGLNRMDSLPVSPGTNPATEPTTGMFDTGWTGQHNKHHS